jgi:hypothetical protein
MSNVLSSDRAGMGAHYYLWVRVKWVTIELLVNIYHQVPVVIKSGYLKIGRVSVLLVRLCRVIQLWGLLVGGAKKAADKFLRCYVPLKVVHAGALENTHLRRLHSASLAQAIPIEFWRVAPKLYVQRLSTGI